MWRCYFVLIFCFSLLPSSFADFLSTAPAPQQSLKIAGQINNNHLNTPAQVASPVNNPVKNNSSPTSSASATAAYANQGNLTADNQASQLSHLSESLRNLKQRTALFEKNAALRLNDLTKQSAVLTATVEQLMRHNRKFPVNTTNTQPAQLSSVVGADSLNSNHSALPHSKLNSFMHTKEGWVTLIGMLILFSTLSIVYMVMRNRRSKAATTHAVKGSVIEDEYDFLNSEEGIIAKLDLARAYEAMQDYAQMREVLQEVVAQGNEQQANEARVLMAGIKE
jgi:FimV-like protein